MLERINDGYPIECTRINYHVNWPLPSDPFYVANTVEANARWTYYGVNYVPYVRVDGLLLGGAWGPWVGMMLDRYALGSPLTIEVSGQMTSATDGSITAEITNTSAAAVSGQLRIVLTESDLLYDSKIWNYVMRDFIGQGTAGEAITVNPSETISRTATFTIAGTWVRANMTGLVFVQDDATKEIYQAGRIFFELDEPELAPVGLTIDDSAGGNGDGFLVPGETARLIYGLTDLNPVGAVGVSAILATSDPRVVISDASATWPDIPSGTTQQSTADPFEITVDPSAPSGWEIAATLTMSESGTGYTRAMMVYIPVGSPGSPLGPDAYGYYAYEDLDAYGPSPAYDWVEIDPTLGGPGTLFTLADNQVRNTALPFTFKYYGQTFTTISICSNGFVALGATTESTYRSGPIPGPEGPPNMVAAFWADLDPTAAGSGKVYTYADQANGRFIVEFSGVEFWDIADLGQPQTFEFILYDPVTHPTPTGDGEIVVQYALVNAPETCVAGIEDGTETIGLEYWSARGANPATHGMAAGRAVKYTTATPSSAAVPAGEGATTTLLTARPNPMRGTGQIRYYLPEAGDVTLRIFSPEGALVRTLLHEEAPAGPGVVNWDGRSDRGLAVPAGVYFFRLSGPGVEVERKIVLQR